MTDIDLAISDGMGGDTEIDLYADVVENELETVSFLLPRIYDLFTRLSPVRKRKRMLIM